MDNRSFNLNFEVNGMVYDDELGRLMQEEFERDLSHSIRLDPKEWQKRGPFRRFLEKVARLASSLL